MNVPIKLLISLELTQINRFDQSRRTSQKSFNASRLYCWHYLSCQRSKWINKLFLVFLLFILMNYFLVILVNFCLFNYLLLLLMNILFVILMSLINCWVLFILNLNVLIFVLFFDFVIFFYFNFLHSLYFLNNKNDSHKGFVA